jgi:hypothetical protein
MDFIFTNNASSRLAAPISAIVTELEVAGGGGAAFPTPAYLQQFAITVKHPDTSEVEIMYVIEKIYEDVWTVVRGREGTVALSFPENSIVAHQITAGILEYLRGL